MRHLLSDVRFRTFSSAAFALCFVLLTACGPGRAQTGDDDFGEAGTAIREMRGISPKTLEFVFDVSGSMKSDGNLRRAREATITILREAARPGDRVVLFTFGADTRKVFDKVIQDGEDKAALINQVPSRTDDGAGTNIRKPHHESLQIADANLPRDTAIVLLTDSFNDEPKPTDAAYPDYLNYYTPGGQLTKYPKTPENRDYERLLAKLLASGKLHQYGIGINLDANGRPIERLPQAAPPPSETSEAVPAPQAAPQSPEKPSPVLWISLCSVAVALAAAFVGFSSTKPSVFRITGGPSGTKDFNIKSGQSVRLGGDGATAAFDAYPLSGASAPVAHIKAVRGQLVLVPPVSTASAPNAAPPASAGTPAPAAPPRNQTEAARVYHNGLALEGETPLDFGDEVRIAPAIAGSNGRQFGPRVSLKNKRPEKGIEWERPDGAKGPKRN